VVLLPWPEAHEGQVVTLALADQSAQAEKSAKPAAKAVP
jgi:hypothetical protein